MKTIAVIPCLNEEKFIGDIVSRAKKYVDTVIVVDDGSTDKTSQIAEAAGAMRNQTCTSHTVPVQLPGTG